MSRSMRLLQARFLLALPLVLAGCGNILSTRDGSGAHYGLLRGTVTRGNGAPVANAPVGISCVGSTNEPFGVTTEADAVGRFETVVNAPSIFPPLDGPSYVCRVLTPFTGVPQAEKSITLRVSTSASSRPTTEVSLVVP